MLSQVAAVLIVKAAPSRGRRRVRRVTGGETLEADVFIHLLVLSMKNLLAHGANEILVSAQLRRNDGELRPLVPVQKVEYRVHLVID